MWSATQHSAVLYTCLPRLLSKYNINIANCSFFACFRFLIFHPFSRGSADPICPYVRTPMRVRNLPKDFRSGPLNGVGIRVEFTSNSTIRRQRAAPSIWNRKTTLSSPVLPPEFKDQFQSLSPAMRVVLDAGYCFRGRDVYRIVCLSVCLLVTIASPAKPAEPIEMFVATGSKEAKWNHLCSGSDACCRYRYCSNLF